MNRNTRVRQIHRWVSLAFVLTVIAAFVTAAASLPEWMFYLPLLPLALLMATGTYLFALPYTRRWHGGRRSAPET